MIAILFVLSLINVSRAEDLRLPPGLQFGIATAPGHVEDALEDSWVDWARKGNVSAWSNQIAPDDRLKFFTAPSTEIEWMDRLGAEWVRTGVDWGRIQPTEKPIYDEVALARYDEILGRLKKNHRVLLTLFHHSLPKWAIEKGGWSNPEVLGAWDQWVSMLANRYAKKVDAVVTLNEPVIFVLLSDGLREWPNSSGKRGGISILDWNPLPIFKGRVFRSLDHLQLAHRHARDLFRENNPKIPVGIAHHYSRHRRTEGFLPWLLHETLIDFMNWDFPESLEDAVDFVGVNYYGSELFSGTGLIPDLEREVSEAGRAVDSHGLYELLIEIRDRMKSRNRSLPIWITENGVADRTDHLRVPYLYEHLAAIAQATADGVQVATYFHWTLSDNWEWGDGYCPKFGLLEVDRSDLTKRKPRPSFNAYRELIRTRVITDSQRRSALDQYWALQGTRAYCRGDEPTRGLDTPQELGWRASRLSFSVKD